MTEAQAWRRLAEAMHSAPLDEDHRFICWWLERWWMRPAWLNLVLAERMRAYIHIAQDTYGAAYGDYTNVEQSLVSERENRAARVLACLMFAAQAEEEGR